VRYTKILEQIKRGCLKINIEIAPFFRPKTQKTGPKDPSNVVKYSCETNITTTRLYQK
jgi:hypothetical protein